MTAAIVLTSYGLALGFRVADALRVEAALYRLRRIDRLILEGNGREARRTFAAVEREFARERESRPMFSGEGKRGETC